MPKRKRSAQDELGEKLTKHRQEIFRALKLAKGFERQRMAKRQHDRNSTPDKRARIEHEIAVLKSLDLQSVANAHLCSSILKIKDVAESPLLPGEIKNGVPKPEISEQERAALHNVTSALYNQDRVRTVLEKAVADICLTLGVPVPGKKGKRKKKDNEQSQATGEQNEEQSAGEDNSTRASDQTPRHVEEQTVKTAKEEEEWDGFSDSGDEERAVSQLDDMLGSPSDSESDESEAHIGDEASNEELDPMEITDEEALEASEAEVSIADSDSDDLGSEASAESPPPKTARKESKTVAVKGRPTESAFLPSLMAGYISGSESEASDIDVAPPMRKNRRGQRARRQIWERKYGDKAKHLHKEQTGRDAGWDLKRGAVDGTDKTPWKKGIRTPFERSAGRHEGHSAGGPEQRKPPRKKDDEGPLHPSWVARKKAKEALQNVKFEGKKITFD